MRFKNWLYNEIEINVNKMSNMGGSNNPAQINQATTGMAKNTIAKFGKNIIQDISSAPSKTQAGKVAVDFAQKTLDSNPQQSKNAPTDALSVGAQIYKQATGQDLKTMRKQ